MTMPRPRLLAAVLVSISLSAFTSNRTLADDPKPSESDRPKLDDRALYRHLLPSTCWIVVRDPADRRVLKMGTGWLSDAQRRVIVTNEHVVRDFDALDVYFPIEKDGRTLVEPDHYLKKEKPIAGMVIDRDSGRDLAVIQLESLPEKARALTLAGSLPDPGERIVTVAGFPEGSEGLWGLTAGIVRLAYRRTHANGAVAGIVETDLPFNRGNSGGPVVNTRGELVAVVEGFVSQARQVSMTIDVNEVRSYLKTCESLIEPKTADAFYRRARRRHNANRYELALADYGEALKLKPRFPMAHVNRGWIFHHRKDYRTAISEFDDALKLDPENTSAYDGRGTCYRELGEYSRALDDLTQAIRRSPSDASLYFRRANTFRRSGKLTEALPDLNRAVQLDPNDVDHLVGRGQVYRLLHRYEEAIRDLEAAWRLAPTDSRWLYELGYVYSDKKDNENAWTMYTMAIRINDQESQYWNNRGIVLNRLKRHEEALSDFERARTLNPNKALYYKHIGDTLYDLRRFVDALRSYDEAIERDGKSASAFRARGDCHKALGNAKAAQADYQKAKTLSEDS